MILILFLVFLSASKAFNRGVDIHVFSYKHSTSRTLPKSHKITRSRLNAIVSPPQTNDQTYESRQAPLILDRNLLQPAFSKAPVKTNNLLSWMLGLAFMSISASIMSLPAVLPLIDSDPALRVASAIRSDISMATIMSLATVAIVIGKFLLGPMTDRIGGNKVTFVTAD